MDAPGINDSGCRKLFDAFGAVMRGMRLASVSYVMIDALQALVHGAGEAGIAVEVAERNEAHGMHPRVQAIRFSAGDFPAHDVQAVEANGGHVLLIGAAAQAEEVMNLFFDLDVGRLPFDEAVRRTSARRLSAVQKPPGRMQKGNMRRG
ncbi:hypothetical protein [Noviherbaspirillum galbum]|uniref:Uncharacterized protein n=1 Tax=Noviherbaspirillum galbum TaxID=2709383 RepID=A0A6B3SFZ6_9BURK|nr:hypothetical protein [Noviherbaspirillum galbum]NEX59588.1 hypothetical protein [Noviherbaspirillum galbum]